MNEIDFRRQLYANPQKVDQELLDAARGNPVLQKILEQTQELDTELVAVMNNVEVPAGLADKLMAIPAAAPTETGMENLGGVASKPAANSNFFQYYALAASVLLALGITFSLTINSGPSYAELTVGDDVLRHLYIDDGSEIDEIGNGISANNLALPAINAIMAGSGTRLISNEFLQNLPIRSARPCKVVPAFQSAHLIFMGTQGAVSVIVINNSPVSVEYNFRDDRFNGVVVPMGGGNLVLVGENNEDLEQYKMLFSENIDWVI